jgi:hypothetical protein
MFNMMLGASKRSNFIARRAFSNQVATTSADASQTPKNIQTLWQYSQMVAKQNAVKDQDEAAYLNTLKTYSTVPGAYTKLSEKASSHHLSEIRKRINKIV